MGLARGDEVSLVGDAGNLRGLVKSIDPDGDVFVQLTDGSRHVFARRQLQRVTPAEASPPANPVPSGVAPPSPSASAVAAADANAEAVATTPSSASLADAAEATASSAAASAAATPAHSSASLDACAAPSAMGDGLPAHAFIGALQSWPEGVRAMCVGLEAEVDEVALASARAMYGAMME